MVVSISPPLQLQTDYEFCRIFGVDMQEWMESCSYGTDTGKLVVDFVDGNQYDSIAASTESHLQLFLYQATIPDSSTSITAYIA